MKYVIEDSTLKNIADAIRTKANTSDAIVVSDFAERIMDIASGSAGASEWNYQEFSTSDDININGNALGIELNNNVDVSVLLMFPLSNQLKGQYAWCGGVYIPDVFNAGIRTSYGVTTTFQMGCGYNNDNNISVTDGILNIKYNSNCFLYTGDKYGILYK